MKKQLIFIAFAVVFAALCFIIPSCCKDRGNDILSLPTAGLVAYYPFNGNAQDESGFSNHGTNNGAEFVKNRNGEDNKAAYFNGGSYILVPHTERINFGFDEEYTVSCWVKYGQQTKIQTIDNYLLSKWYMTPNPGALYPFNLRIINHTHDNTTRRGTWYSGRRDGSTCNNITQVQGNVVDDDNWHHIVVTKRGNQIFGYTDGVVIEQKQDVTKCSTQNLAPMYIGCYHPGPNNPNDRWYKGAIDDLRIYNRALKDEEIQQLFKE